MTFADWVRETRGRFRDLQPHRAASRSAQAFWRGACRRTLDPHVGRAVWERGDWDVLVVLDACRVDLLEEVADEYAGVPEHVPAVWSNASCSIDWIERTFNEHPDEAERAAYVSANPFASHDTEGTKSADLTEETVGHLDLLYKTHWQDVGSGVETVPPDVVTDHAIDRWRRRDELGVDRMIVHYMQPHEPFWSRPEWGSGGSKLLRNLIDSEATAGASVFPRLRDGDVAMDEFWSAYVENLRWVLDDVHDRLLENCDGRVVLSADHGNGLGDWWSWHHPPASLAPPIRRVPWVGVDGVDERTAAPDVDAGEQVEQTSREQLAALGYLEGGDDD